MVPGAKVGKSVLTTKENLWENDVNFVKVTASEGGKKTPLRIPKKRWHELPRLHGVRAQKTTNLSKILSY